MKPPRTVATILNAAKACPDIVRIIPSEIMRVPVADPKIKFFTIPEGLRIIVRTPTTQQILIVHTSSPMAARIFLGRAFAEAERNSPEG